MGRRPSETVLGCFQTDIDAISDTWATSRTFSATGCDPLDASLFAMLRHVADQPQRWPGSGYLESKRNLVAYLERIRAEHKI